MPDKSGKYLIIPIDRDDVKINFGGTILKKVLNLSQEAGVDVLENLADWLANTDNIEKVVNKLKNLQVDSLSKLNSVIGIGSLKNVLALWEQNRNNADEEFWQNTLKQHSFVFSQLFSYPVIIFKDKAYVGGKSIENQGGNFVDFLLTNHLTMNSALIEIKTPKTSLLGKQYRTNSYSISDELSGSIVQVASYKSSLLQEYNSLIRGASKTFEAFNPPAIVVIGNTNELKDSEKRMSFELFRNGLKDVQVVTYDELFAKVETLVNLLEGKIDSDEDLPF